LTLTDETIAATRALRQPEPGYQTDLSERAGNLSQMQRQLLVIDDGRIVEQGTDRQLLEQRGVYYQLSISQFNGHTI